MTSAAKQRWPLGGIPPGCTRSGIRLLAGILLLAAGLGGSIGCAHFTVDDQELDEAILTARDALDAGDTDAAISTLSGVARRRSESVLAREMLVEACLRRDTIETRRYAEELLRELIELDPAEPHYRYQLSELLLRRGFDRYAYQELAELRALAPNHAAGYLALAGYHHAQWRRFGENLDLQAMLMAYERALRLDPASPQANRGLAMNLMLVGRMSEARVTLEDFMAMQGVAELPSADPVRLTTTDVPAASPAMPTTMGAPPVTGVAAPESGVDPWLHAMHAACLADEGLYNEAWVEYEFAFDHMSQEERAPFQDMTTLVDPHLHHHYRDMSPGDAHDFLRAFWKPLDPTPTTPVNERLIEHYRRVTMADVLYANPRLELRGFDTARGDMYIRYGPPLTRHFENGYVTNRLVPPAWVHTYRAGDAVFTVTFFDYALSGRFYRSINQLPSYADLAAYVQPQSYRHHYDGIWLGHSMALAGFRDAAGATREELYLAVPLVGLERFPGASLSIDAVAFDEDWVELERVSEEIRIDTAPVGGVDERALVHQFHLPLRPGAYRVATQVSGEDPATGRSSAVFSTQTEELEVEAYPPAILALSGLELAFDIDMSGASTGAGGAVDGRFEKGPVTVVPNATGTYRDDELLYVYFEIYGLSLSDGTARYELSYRIRPEDHEANTFFARLANALRNKSFIEARIEEESPRSTVERHLAIDVAALEPDRYRLTLLVTDRATGAVTERRVEFDKLRPSVDRPRSPGEPGAGR